TFSYQDKIKRLHQIAADICEGQITTIIGPNGCGKSTLLGVLTNHLRPQTGSVVLDGKAIHQYKSKELAKRLGVVHQQNSAPADMTVEKLVHYGRLPHKTRFASDAAKAKDDEMVNWAMERTGIYEKRNEPI